MAIVGKPVLSPPDDAGSRFHHSSTATFYHVTSHEGIPCYPAGAEASANASFTEIPHGRLVKFIGECMDGLWEVDVIDQNMFGGGQPVRCLIGSYAWPDLMIVRQRRRS